MGLNDNILDFVKRIDPSRKQDYIAGQNPNLNLYKDWYKGQNSWHSRKTHENGEVVNTTIEASGTPKLIAEDWASNYANENTIITVSSENENNKANDKVNEILHKNSFFAKFNPFAEKFNALGCGATVVIPKKFEFVDNKIVKSEDNQIKIYFLDADRVIPITNDEDDTTECAFVRITTNETILQVHILVNGQYVIGEVKGNNPQPGKTAESFDYDNAVLIETKSTTPLFQVWHPNISNSANNQPYESVYSQAIGWFKLTDTIFDCWYKEFKRGAKKRFISAEMREIGSDGQPIDMKDFLEDEDIIVPLGSDGKSFINEFNAELRVDPITKSLVGAMNGAARMCGLGDSTFEIGEAGGRPIQTATAAILKESKLYKNIIKQENFATSKIKGLLLAIKEVYNSYISNETIEFNEDDIQVVYDDNIMEDTQKKKENQLNEVNAGIMSIAEYRANWYNEDLESAKKFVHDNALLIDKYTLALQSGVMTPETFVDIVYGEDYKYKNELIQMIKEQYSQPKEPTNQNTGFEDESDEPAEEEKDQEDDE